MYFGNRWRQDLKPQKKKHLKDQCFILKKKLRDHYFGLLMEKKSKKGEKKK